MKNVGFEARGDYSVVVYSWQICISFVGLKFLVRLCTDMGMKEAQEYATKLKKAEKAKELKEQVWMENLTITS